MEGHDNQLNGLGQQLETLLSRISGVDLKVDETNRRLEVLDREVNRNKERLLRLEGTESALRIAVEAVTALAAKVSNAVEKMDEIASAAAEKAIQSDRRNRSYLTQRKWLFWAAVTGGFGTVLLAATTMLVNLGVL